MKRLLAVLAIAPCATAILLAQGAYTPYGLDLEIPNGNTACYQSSCSILDKSQQAKAQWVRIFLPWHSTEPNAPTGQPNPSVMGMKSGLHAYNWEYIDTIVNYATSRNINVLVTFIQAPAWANGNPDPSCVSWGGQICAGNKWSNAWPVTNTAYLEDFAYNTATHLFGRVSYYEVWNEPNLSNNFNPELLPDPDHQFMNYFMQYYAFPISTGLKAVSSSISLVGPAVTVTNACGVPHSNCDSGWGSWFLPISRYFLSTFDVISVHAYNADHGGVRDNLDKLNNTYIKYQRPIWLTETGFTQSQDPNGNILALYVDEYNRGAWWTKTFYHDLYDDNSTKYGLLDPNWNPRPAFYTYQTLYNH